MYCMIGSSSGTDLVIVSSITSQNDEIDPGAERYKCAFVIVALYSSTLMRKRNYDAYPCKIIRCKRAYV